ncbi:MAG: DNA polymerase III subunit beta [Epsilonproteobacteria bacterium]|nr:DNA polymerase III subunit beta [Campylobacterota bacterium]
MKVKVQKQVIESILINLQPFLEKKDASQITSHIFFDAKENECTVKATDLEIGLSINTKHIKVEENGICTANGKKLLDIIRILKDDELTLEVLDSSLVIKQKQSKFKLPIFDASAYPAFPQTDNKPQITLDSLQLIQSFKKISPAIDTNNPKFELNGALINIKEKSTDIVGTDTRRLAISTINNASSEELAIIVPKKAILEIQKLFLDKISIFYDSVNLIIINDNYYFYSKLINGKYPDYARIIPSSIKHNLKLPKKDMAEAIKMMSTISQDIKLTINPNNIIFHALSSDNLEAKTELDINSGIGERFEISFNSRYILDFLYQIDDDIFEMNLNESNLPFVVKSNQFMTIIMPIIL